ncbi:ABC transporter permease [Salinibacillus xinjiangensis]|uniref:ABC transporter permease subunit n=1 Tax=Salinibacillus xinjiangensis TaxID=1229268 RepID=A0A6G1X956_9BACI|nr:ABC transporter permease [Salinibacillus xinjiangensis]MRG87504.1 ABC transporter permease subunit [Salinibacillus xinjiangensis]
MIWPIIKKQFRLMVRDRTNFTLLLVMPLVLVFIIKFSIGDLMTQGIPEIDATIAIAEHTEEEADLTQLANEWEEQPLPEEAKTQLVQGLNQFQPIRILKEEILGSEELQDVFAVVDIAPEEVEAAKKEEKYTAIIEVPEQFSYQLAKSSFLNEGDTPQLTLFVNKSEDLVTEMLQDILLVYEEEMRTTTVLERNGVGDLKPSLEEIRGDIVSVSMVEPITSTSYYVVGMSVMFVLYIASTMGSYAYLEKRDHVFERILLANVSKWRYFVGMVLASSLLAFTQLMILFGFSVVVFGVTWPNIWQFLLIAALLSITVGAIASLVVSLNYRFQSEKSSTVFGNAIVTVFAFLGGSFYPIKSDIINLIGNFTPNGAGMTAFFATLQGYGMNEIVDELMVLGALTFVVIIAAVLVFPKRGEQS